MWFPTQASHGGPNGVAPSGETYDVGSVYQPVKGPRTQVCSEVIGVSVAGGPPDTAAESPVAMRLPVKLHSLVRSLKAIQSCHRMSCAIVHAP